MPRLVGALGDEGGHQRHLQVVDPGVVASPGRELLEEAAPPIDGPEEVLDPDRGQVLLQGPAQVPDRPGRVVSILLPSVKVETIGVDRDERVGGQALLGLASRLLELLPEPVERQGRIQWQR